jgi:L-histidine N-alpha-methyltransferase
MEVALTEGEYIRTEISAKFRPKGVAAELSDAGFALERWWTDSQNRFGVSLARARN